MNKLLQWVKGEIKDRLDDYEGQDIFVGDLASTLFESENANGSYTCNSHSAIKWVKDYFKELGEYAEEYENTYGCDLYNPLKEPEKFQVVMVIFIAGCIISQLECLDSIWFDTVTLDKKLINKIKEEL